MRVRVDRVRRSAITAAAFMALVGGLSAPASAPAAATVEAVADGGFENTTCTTYRNEWGADVVGCENPHWEPSGTQAMPCLQASCVPGRAFGGDGYAKLGGSPTVKGTQTYAGALTQTVTLPEDGPKTLSFAFQGFDDAPGPIEALPDGFTIGNFAVTVDGAALFTSTAADAPRAWQRETVDLEGYSGKHTIGFRTDCTRLLDGMPIWFFPCDEFDVDDVSLMVVPDQIPVGPAPTFRHTPKRVSASRTARFTFSAGEAGTKASFECSLDGAGYEACVSPAVFRVLKGHHRFRVRATSAGSTSKAAQWEWRVRRHR